MSILLVANNKRPAKSLEEFWIPWANYCKWHWMVESALDRDCEAWSNDEGLQRFSQAEAQTVAEYVEAILGEMEGDTWYAYPLEDRALHCEDRSGNKLPPEEAKKLLAEGVDIHETGAFSRKRLQEFADFCRNSGGFRVF